MWNLSFKLCEMSENVGKFSVCSGRGKSDLVPGLDHPASAVVKLANALLNERKFLVAATGIQALL